MSLPRCCDARHPEGLGGVWTLRPDPDASWGQGSDPTGNSGWVTRHGAPLHTGQGPPCTRDSGPEATVQAGDTRARQQDSTVPRLIGALAGGVQRGCCQP